MPEDVFWKSTPRKLFALLDVYMKLNGVKTDEKTKKEKNDDAIKSLMSW